MPIPVKKFEDEGLVPKQRKVQEAIMKVLQANPASAFSSEELEDIVGTRRESINQALRSLEGKGLIDRGLIEQNKRRIIYVKIREKKEESPHV